VRPAYRAGRQLLQQAVELGIAGDAELAPQPVDQMAPPFGKVHDQRGEPARMQTCPQQLTSGVISSGSTATSNDATVGLAETMFQCRSTVSAG
jgi:hypothetical protein